MTVFLSVLFYAFALSLPIAADRRLKQIGKEPHQKPMVNNSQKRPLDQ
jgi:hypothetical protein